YAQALSDLARGSAGAPELAVAASGGVLLARIRRVLGVPAPDADSAAWPLAGVLLLLSAGGAGVLALQPPGVARPHFSGSADTRPTQAWVSPRDEGRTVVFKPGRRIVIQGMGRLHIDTKQRLVELGPGQQVLIHGQPLRETCSVAETDVLSSRSPDGTSF